MRSVIAGRVDHTVTLGQSGYDDALTVTSTGIVAPTMSGANAVIVPVGLTNARILNNGGIYGAQGAAQNYATGGIGIDASAAVRITNTGNIIGGTGGAGPAYGGAGGVGIALASGGSLGNSGTIAGGTGGIAQSGQKIGALGGDGVNLAAGSILRNSGHITGGTGGMGGVGVDLASGGTISNSGTITGGVSGLGGYDSHEAGGVGVVLGMADSLLNTGTINGGAGVYTQSGISTAGGIGVEVTAADAITNQGTILGGSSVYGEYAFSYGSANGGVGLQLLAGGSVRNGGLISGGRGGGAEGTANGGAGIDLVTGGTLTNTGTVTGGRAGTLNRGGEYHFAAAGGTGVQLYAGGLVKNSGLIMGGTGNNGSNPSEQGGGGAGVYLKSGGNLDNSGTIIGGTGFGLSISYFGAYNEFGDGGAGVYLKSGGEISNSGTIIGGAGTIYGYPYGLPGGTGGAGVSLTGGVLRNTGTVMGGKGGSVFNSNYGKALGGNGGTGVYLTGGTLITSGVISGGAGGTSPYGNGMMGEAVQFGTLASTLVVDPGAVFNGAIVTNSAAPDTLVLSGTASGTLTGLGSTANFTTITEDAHAHWTLTGSVSGTGVLQIGSGATLALIGPASIAIAFAAGHETVSFAAPTEVTSTITGFGKGDEIDLQNLSATSLAYAHGTLTLLDHGQVVDQLAIAGNLISADFGLRADGQGGAEIYGQDPFAGNAIADNGYASSDPIRPTDIFRPVSSMWSNGDGHNILVVR